MVSKAIFSVLFFLWIGKGYAQKDYFILIQSENNQPFYARLNNKTFSSSEIGHLIIPQIKDGEYNITIGFPKDIYPEQKFKVIVNKKELGLQLKNLGNKGWALYNWQTQESYASVQADDPMPKITPADTPKTEIKAGPTAYLEKEKTENQFSRLMADVVNDTAFLYNTYVDKIPQKDTIKAEVAKSTPVKTDTPATNKAMMQPVSATDSSQREIAAIKTNQKKKNPPPAKAIKEPKKNTDSTIIAMNTAVKAADDSLQKTKSVTNKNIVAKEKPSASGQATYVKKLSEQTTDTLLQQVYISVDRNGKIDTIQLTIPMEVVIKESPLKNEKDTATQIAKQAAPSKNEITEAIKDSTQAITGKEDGKAVVVETVPKVADSLKRDSSVAKQTAPQAKPVVNTNCKISATDYDVDKLRVKMIAMDNEDDKIAAARKYFKLKCFTTKQIKALSEVFPSDEGRYRLFDTAYPFVSDATNFPRLVNLLTAPYYINRFNAMVMQ